jgi:hypothetical protein
LSEEGSNGTDESQGTSTSPESEVPADADDGYGSTLARGDFNGDARADVAIGIPFKKALTVTAAGAVHVLYGSPGGLATTGNQRWNHG